MRRAWGGVTRDGRGAPLGARLEKKLTPALQATNFFFRFGNLNLRLTLRGKYFVDAGLFT